MGAVPTDLSSAADLEVGRFLDFGSRDALRNGQGLCAQLLSLQLSGSLCAQSLSNPDGRPLVAGMLGICRQHLKNARETPQVKQSRHACTQRRPVSAACMPKTLSLCSPLQTGALAGGPMFSASAARLQNRKEGTLHTILFHRYNNYSMI
jgi:hypothetical protein